MVESHWNGIPSTFHDTFSGGNIVTLAPDQRSVSEEVDPRSRVKDPSSKDSKQDKCASLSNRSVVAAVPLETSRVNGPRTIILLLRKTGGNEPHELEQLMQRILPSSSCAASTDFPDSLSLSLSLSLSHLIRPYHPCASSKSSRLHSVSV